MTLTEAKDYINLNLPDRKKASDPMYKAGIVRAVLFVMLDAAQGLIDALKTSISAKLNVTDFNDGLRFNYTIRLQPETGRPTNRYFKIATLLPEDDTSLSDMLRLLAVVGGWGSNQKNVIDLHAANRGGAYAYATVNGDANGCGFALYRQSNKTAVLYLRMPNNFFVANVSIVQCYQTVVHPSWVEEVPTGTLVYDSTDPITFPPSLQLGATSGVKGFFRTGQANRGFQLTGYRSGGSQTLNTNGYLELKLDDGNILKVAVLN